MKTRTRWFAVVPTGEVEDIEARIDALLRQKFGPKKIPKIEDVMNLQRLESDYLEIHQRILGYPPSFLPTRSGHRAKFLSFYKTKLKNTTRIAA